MTVENYKLGDVKVDTFTIYSKQGPLNAVEFIQTASVFESLYAPCITAEIVLQETKGLRALLPLRGEESITLQWTTPSRKTRRVDLSVVSLTDASAEDNKSAGFVLRAASDEALKNKSLYVQKSYNTTIASMIKDLLSTELRTNKKLDIQETKGAQKIIVSNKHVYEAIDMLRRRAASNSDKSSLFVFFENKNGLNLKTIEWLMANAEELDSPFIYDKTLGAAALDTLFRNIMIMQHPQQFMSARKLELGGLKTQVKSFDLRTLSYQKNDKTFDQTSIKSADGAINPTTSDTFTQKYGNKAGKHVMVAQDTSCPATYIADVAADRQGAIAEYSQSTLQMLIPGDSSLSAGMKIDTVIKKITSVMGDKQAEDPILSGKYLVTKMRHMIGPIDAEVRYTCAIEVIKGGYHEAL